MVWLFVGLAALLLVLGLASAFVRVSPATLTAVITRGGGAAAIALAALFAVSGRAIFSAPLAALGIYLLGMQPTRKAPTGQPRSTVRSAALEMELDHATGEMRGRVLVGRFEGQELARLTLPDLLALRTEIAADAESVTLLEAYLDRREPLWREDREGDTAAGDARPSEPGSLSDEEAYQVLGLERGASEAEIREAHRRLMLAVHPDRGGSTFLAAKINAAKDRLLRNHGRRSAH